MFHLLSFQQILCLGGRMGHACTKDANAEKLERRRVERERRLGLVRQPQPNQTLQPGLIPNGMWPRGMTSQPSLQPRNTPTFQVRQPHVSFQQPAFSKTPVVQPRSHLRTPERPRNTIPNPNSPFHDPRSRLPSGHSSAGLAEGVLHVEDHTGVLKPVVVQALNQLCAIELQVRVQTINEEMWGRNELLLELEHLQEAESFRVATLELVALEGRSRSSVAGQEDQANRLLLEWASESRQEARLAGLIRETQERHSRSLPSSAQVTPLKHRPLSRPESPSLMHNPHYQNSRQRSDLGWAPELTSRPTSFRQVSPPRVQPTRTDYMNHSDASARFTSQEEAALDAKIARQRGLMESTRSLYHSDTRSGHFDANSFISTMRTAPLAPTTTNSQPMRPAPKAPTEGPPPNESSSMSLREASFEATRNRINALSYYQ